MKHEDLTPEQQTKVKACKTLPKSCWRWPRRRATSFPSSSSTNVLAPIYRQAGMKTEAEARQKTRDIAWPQSYRQDDYSTFFNNITRKCREGDVFEACRVGSCARFGAFWIHVRNDGGNRLDLYEAWIIRQGARGFYFHVVGRPFVSRLCPAVCAPLPKSFLSWSAR